VRTAPGTCAVRNREPTPGPRAILDRTGDEPTDAALIAASLDDGPSFAAVFDRHYPAIHAYVARRAGADVADDVASATFLEAFASRRRYDQAKPSARPWLYGIATNLLRHHRRAEVRRIEGWARAAAASPDLDPPADVAARLDAQAAKPLLAHALARLSAADRDTLLLYAWEDLSYAEIASALAVPIGTVRSRLNRARRELRELVRPSGQVWGGVRTDSIVEVPW
jgi:RNA polymerase sigma factor (sigma-70 family)